MAVQQGRGVRSPHVLPVRRCAFLAHPLTRLITRPIVGLGAEPAPAPQPDTIFQTSAFSGLKVAFAPCRPTPPSYMRLTVAISRVFERWGFCHLRRQGPANLPQKEGHEHPRK